MGKKKGLIENLDPVQSKDEARERGRNGGIASGVARRAKRTSREVVEMLDRLPAKDNGKKLLESLGVGKDDLTQLTLRLVALHKKALSGDAAANKLLIEIRGESATQTVNLEIGDETRAAYERAAKTIKGQ